jgi:hypothetical protein
MRTKIITIEGDERQYKIGALSLQQVEEYIAPIGQLEDGKTGAFTKIRAFDLVCYALNNGRADGEPEWTIERIKAEFDMVSFVELQKEAIKLSGLEIREKGTQLGEALTAME